MHMSLDIYFNEDWQCVFSFSCLNHQLSLATENLMLF